MSEKHFSMRRGRRVWVFCMKSRAVFILAVAVENWNIYDSVLKQEGRRFFHSWMWPLACVTTMFFSSAALSLLHPCHCSFCEQRLVCSAVTLALSQPGDAPGAGRKCHFGVHHGNHKQSPSLSSACCVHSGLWLYLVFSISGLRIQLSPAAFQLLSWKYEIFI